MIGSKLNGNLNYIRNKLNNDNSKVESNSSLHDSTDSNRRLSNNLDKKLR